MGSKDSKNGNRYNVQVTTEEDIKSYIKSIRGDWVLPLRDGIIRKNNDAKEEEYEYRDRYKYLTDEDYETIMEHWEVFAFAKTASESANWKDDIMKFCIKLNDYRMQVVETFHNMREKPAKQKTIKSLHKACKNLENEKTFSAKELQLAISKFLEQNKQVDKKQDMKKNKHRYLGYLPKEKHYDNAEALITAIKV